MAKKLIIEKCVFTKISYKGAVKFGEITIALEPDDIIRQEYIEPYEGSVEAWEGHYELNVYRMVEETDAEYEERLKDCELFDARLKEARYITYLKLKKEFENEEN